ncbi:hypothetical protein PanWU01x14_011330 [Parasponia andersonii]|uniref:Uncharacterized protein n=1 Tax=Parasponia andersonii TaxID=3476 RepID=A0A2P5E1K5_PARAD|nr:hypothetical protein PanWU01x14_011330 [Parasponia andersonii]
MQVGAEASKLQEQNCSRDVDCTYKIKCGQGVLKLCDKGICECVGQEIPSPPPVLLKDSVFRKVPSN